MKKEVSFAEELLYGTVYHQLLLQQPPCLNVILLIVFLMFCVLFFVYPLVVYVCVCVRMYACMYVCMNVCLFGRAPRKISVFHSCLNIAIRAVTML